VMKQSLLDPPPVLPGLEAALPIARQASSSLLVTALSVIALATAIAALAIAIVR